MKRLLQKGFILLLAALLIFSAGIVSAADEVKFGDADGDGELTAQDASTIQRYLTRFRMMDAAALSRADIDGDGAVTAEDASMILNAIMSAEFTVPAVQSVSMLVTSDMRGFAWDPASTKDDPGACTAMNVAACVMAMREENPELLLFDVGGSLFGSSIADDYATRSERMYGPMTALFVKMKYNAVLLGDEAFTYPSQTVRREVNELIYRKIAVLGANLRKGDPTVFDPEGVLWNDLVPYKIIEVPQGEDKAPLRLCVIGVTQPDLAPSDDEVLPVDPIDIYAKIRRELKNQVDYTVLLYHGNTEVDALGQGEYSLRDFLKRTDSIDLVLAAHGGSDYVRSELNASGVEIPIVSLPGGTETVTKVSVSLREKGRPAVLVERIDPSASVPDDTVTRAVRPYVSALSGVMDMVVCTVGERIDAYDPNVLGSSDCMEVIHEMQIYSARRWIEQNELDLPHEILSIAYPYIEIGGLREGALRYRDVYSIKTETPRYTLLLVRGGELRAWLSAYGNTLSGESTVYSLYGVSYLLNTLNPEDTLGFLEHSSGLAVEDDEVFTLILAERDDYETTLRSYLDETWMPYEDRVVEGMTIADPDAVGTTDNPVTAALTIYLESVETLVLKHLYNWILI